tara:strand:- start:16496 stop:17098 length:603 start_codon:yes stop_codon:yes gene_type:complete
VDRFNLDWIAPVIFLLIYFLSRLFSRRSGDDDAEQGPRLPDVAKRTRDVQEEIGRRIAERQRQYEVQDSEVPYEEPRTPVQSEDEVFQSPTRELVSIPRLQPNLEEARARMVEQTEELKKLQEQLEKPIRKLPNPNQRRSKNDIYGDGFHVGSGRSRGFKRVIRRMGGDSHALKDAFLYGEILGPPVGVRRRRFMQMFEE